jgi:phosphopantetheine adenylyltransferase
MSSQSPWVTVSVGSLHENSPLKTIIGTLLDRWAAKERENTPEQLPARSMLVSNWLHTMTEKEASQLVDIHFKEASANTIDAIIAENENKDAIREGLRQVFAFGFDEHVLEHNPLE